MAWWRWRRRHIISPVAGFMFFWNTWFHLRQIWSGLWWSKRLSFTIYFGIWEQISHRASHCVSHRRYQYGRLVNLNDPRSYNQHIRLERHRYTLRQWNVAVENLSFKDIIDDFPIETSLYIDIYIYSFFPDIGDIRGRSTTCRDQFLPQLSTVVQRPCGNGCLEVNFRGPQTLLIHTY